MTSAFIQKKLSAAHGLPEILLSQRRKAGLSLDDLSLQTGISAKYLIALEKGYYHLMPGEIYLKQFVKKLADFFHLNEKMLLQIYQSDKNTQPALFEVKPKAKHPAIQGHWLSPALLKKSSVVLVLVALISYLSWEIKNIFTPPVLTVISPVSQSLTNENFIEIIGQTEPESEVYINQQKISLEPDGSFKQKVDLTVGLNVFTIASSKAHSKPRLETVSILRQQSETAQLLDIGNLENSFY